MDDWACLETPEPERETLFGYPVIFTDTDAPQDWGMLVLGDWSCWIEYVLKPRAQRAQKERQP